MQREHHPNSQSNELHLSYVQIDTSTPKDPQAEVVLRNWHHVMKSLGKIQFQLHAYTYKTRMKEYCQLLIEVYLGSINILTTWSLRKQSTGLLKVEVLLARDVVPSGSVVEYYQ